MSPSVPHALARTLRPLILLLVFPLSSCERSSAVDVPRASIQLSSEGILGSSPGRLYEVTPGVADTRSGVLERQGRIARALALSLSTRALVRERIHTELARSRLKDAEIEFAPLLSGNESLLADELASSLGQSQLEFAASLDSLRPLALYLRGGPSEHVWQDGDTPNVATFLNDEGPALAYDAEGQPLPISLDDLPSEPTLFLIPSEKPQGRAGAANRSERQAYAGAAASSMMTSSPLELVVSYLPDLHEPFSDPEIYVHVVAQDTATGALTWWRCSGDAMDASFYTYSFDQNSSTWQGSVDLAASYDVTDRILYMFVFEDDNDRCDGFNDLVPDSDVSSFTDPSVPVAQHLGDLTGPVWLCTDGDFPPALEIGLCQERGYQEIGWEALDLVEDLINDDFVGYAGTLQADCFASGEGPQLFYLYDGNNNATGGYIYVDVDDMYWEMCPPPPLDVGIMGPTEVLPDAECQYAADVDGGHPPYSYAWVQDGDTIGTSASQGVDTGSADFSLTLFVVDDYEEDEYDLVNVDVDGGASFCLPPS